MKAIAAVNNYFYLGGNGKMLWHCPEDLAQFKGKTMGCTCLVGRKTYNTLPKLEGRDLVVVGDGYFSLEDALKQHIDWVIGGGSIYTQTLHLCDEVHLSHINNWKEGDVKLKFPEGWRGEIIHSYFLNKP